MSSPLGPVCRIVGSLPALAIGGVGGAVFSGLGLPLPWVLGSIAATSAVALTSWIRVDLAADWRSGALVVIGLMLGQGFDDHTLGHMISWLPSILVMMLLSVAMLIIAYLMFRHLRGMDRATAFLAAAPGGASIVSVLASAYSVDARRVVFAHVARLVSLLVIAPILVGLVSDTDLSAAVTLQGAPGASEIGFQGLWLLVAGLFAWALAVRLGLPSGLLLVPLFISAVLHASGLMVASVPGPIAVLAQVVIGTNIGVKFYGYRMWEIAADGAIGISAGVAMAACVLIAATAITSLSGLPPEALILSYLPGGAPELGTVALILGISPAMVATHHLIRVVCITIAISPAMRLLQGSTSPERAN